MLIKNLNELVLDTPDAPTILGNFIARSIADDCIPPKFLQSYKGKVSHIIKYCPVLYVVCYIIVIFSEILYWAQLYSEGME